MNVNFREVDPFNCWIWLLFRDVPTQGEKDYVDGVFDSWYFLGKLGGFNSENLQVNSEGSEISWMNYDNEESQKALPALMHNVGQMEYQGKWARCWVDIGTSDGLCIDILINTLKQIDIDFVQIESVLIGGVNEDWPVEDHPDSIFPTSN